MPEELSERDALIIYPSIAAASPPYMPDSSLDAPRPTQPASGFRVPAGQAGFSVRQWGRPDGAQPLPVPPLPLPLPPPLSSFVDVVEVVVVEPVVELVVVDVVGFVVVVGVVVVGLAVVVGVGAGAWVWVTVVVSPPPHAAIPVPAPTPRATAVAMLASRFIALLSSVLMVRSFSSETGSYRSLVIQERGRLED